MKWTRVGTDPMTGCKIFRSGSFTVLLADVESAEYRETKCWHLSISHPHRYPDWDTIADARYSLTPDEVTMAMILPPKEEYVNVHRNCFHLHEIKA